jgi:hypothetical protein
MKAGHLAGLELLLLPQNVGTGQRGVATEINLGCRSKPSEVEPIALPDEIGGFGEIHLASHLLHPDVVGGFRQQADSGGIAGKGAVGKRVHLGESLAAAHGKTASASISTSISGAIRRDTSTIVAAGRTSRKNSPWARPTASQ